MGGLTNLSGVFGAVVIAGIWRIIAGLPKADKYRTVRNEAAQVLSDTDARFLDEDTIEEVLDDKGNITCKPTRFVVILVREARAHFGMMSATEANRIIVGDWMRRKCAEVHVRKNHIAKLLPSAIIWFFVPTEEDILAERIRGADLVRERLEDYETAPHQRRGWLHRLFRGCGPKHDSLGFAKK
jgi:hypothetical protein